MASFLESFLGTSNLVSTLQILLDIGLIVFLFLVLKKRPKSPPGIEELTESLGKVVEETREIAAQFDANLQERQKLIQQILARLDQRVNEARQWCQKIEDLQRQPQVSQATTIPVSPNRQSDNQEILRLAKRGLDAAAIAKRLQKPVGEVELILNLQRISPDR